MRRVEWVAVFWVVVCGLAPVAPNPPRPLCTGLKNPRAVAVGIDGRVYVAAEDKDGGAIFVLKDGKVTPFANGFTDPRGLTVFQQWLFVADKDRIWRIDRNSGKATILAGPKAFPSPPRRLCSIAVDENGTLYACDRGDLTGNKAAVYRIGQGGRVTVVTDVERSPELFAPVALLIDSLSHLLVLDSKSKGLYRVAVAGGKTEFVADNPSTKGKGTCDSLARDWYGRLFLASGASGEVFAIPRFGEKPVLLARGLKSPGLPAPTPDGKYVLVPETKAGTVTALSAQIPGWEIDDRPLSVDTELAFPGLKWTGWKEEISGKPNPLRPLVLTHGGDGSNRVFVATQHGIIHVFPNDQKATKTTVFLDISAKVRYSDDENEEGCLGLTFHPKFKKNGEFFVFYTDKKAPLQNVLSRFRVGKADPNKADPGSEEELLRIKRPFWNHDGGTLCFGPDGYLYVALGDGGAANDPFDNGQNLKSILGKVLRLDVDRKDEGLAYAIPKDNPFVGKEGARPEIFAWGLRNIWRMAFDRKTGELWAADVGQNLWEEINLIRSGGNYGWNRREGLQPFGPKGSGPRKDLIDPIWQYHHDIGKSITGGLVYRGERLKGLQGAYVYGDYVTNKMWALRYDAAKKRVVANRPIRDRGLPILSFGEDERGEIYFMTYSATGQGIYRLVPPKGGGR